MYYPFTNSRQSGQELTSSSAVGGANNSNMTALRRGVSITQMGLPQKKKELDDGYMSSAYFNQSSFPQQRTEKDGLTPSALYGGMSSGFQPLALHPSRGLTNTPPFTRASTAPTYTNMSAMSAAGLPQLSSPPPPPATGVRNNMYLPNTMTSQGIGGAKYMPRPNTLASAISSGLPMSAGNGRNLMSPFNSSNYGTSLSDVSGQNFDLSDFPVLGSRAHGESGLLSGSRSAYGQMNKTSSEPSQEFQMRVEDFPSLPGTSTAKPTESTDTPSDTTFTIASSIPFSEARTASLPYDPAPGGGNKERSGSVGAVGTTKPNVKKPVNVLPSMVQDHYGMVGLLTFIRGAETDPNLVALALGSDLTTLGLNLNSPESLYSTFASPFADSPSRPQDIDYPVPQEYLIHSYIRDKLAPIRLSKYNEDLLFYLYYTSSGDLLQLLAAHELYSRDWRYHKEEKIWITRATGIRPTKVETTYEEGTYCYFDMTTWRKAHREMKVEYDKLAERPHIPPAFTSQQIVSSVSMNA